MSPSFSARAAHIPLALCFLRQETLGSPKRCGVETTTIKRGSSFTSFAMSARPTCRIETSTVPLAMTPKTTFKDSTSSKRAAHQRFLRSSDVRQKSQMFGGSTRAPHTVRKGLADTYGHLRPPSRGQILLLTGM